jgi:hypothetical protein
VRYELQEIGTPTLDQVLGQFLKSDHLGGYLESALRA